MAISGNPGAIPDVDEYQPPAEQAAPPQQEAAPAGEPVAFRDVAPRAATAVQAGIAGLKRIFLGAGAAQQPGIPDEEALVQQGAAGKQGAQRFARGEGAATSEELRNIDYATGIDQLQADEGTKNMIRLDRTVNYKLQKGDQEGAETAAASLLQSGATKVRQAGMVARAAFQQYQATGDPKHLQAASQAMKRAHQLIPDGFDLELNVDPKTHQLVATTVDSGGKVNEQVIDPRAVPQLLQGALDGSAYWKSVFRIGHPTLAGQQEDDARGAAAKAEERGYQQGYEQFKYERGRGDKLEDRAATAEEWDRQQEVLNQQGRSPGERLSRQEEEYFTDWSDRLSQAATPQEQRQLLEEGMGYRYENAKDRSQPIAQDELMFSQDSQYAEVFDEEDVTAMTNIARVIAQKNGSLDGAGAMEVAAQLATSPQLDHNPDGTFNVNGFSLVFNPQLLPALSALRQKHRATE